MMKSSAMSCLFWWLLIWTHTQYLEIYAGPAGRAYRVVREVYPPEIEPENVGNQAHVCIVGDVVYGPDEMVPADQPCLNCRCQPPEVQCETIQCIKTPGCKAVHRPKRCCPDYQCECQYEGKIYSNGEKVESPKGSDECKVCYCRGGEVQCADVSCYIRHDCEAKTVPGQCCPKYDHFPPIEPLMGRPSSTTPPPTSLPEVNSQVLELWPTVYVSPNLSSTGSPDDSNKILDSTWTKKKLEEITIHEIIDAPATTDFESVGESSETLEIIEHPLGPSIKIANKLLFSKQNEDEQVTTPLTVVTLIAGAGNPSGGGDKGKITTAKLKTSTESTHILSLVMKRKSETTEMPTTSTSSTSISTDAIVNEQNSSSTTTPSVSHVITTEIVNESEQNPAHPSIVDVLSFENHQDKGKRIPNANLNERQVVTNDNQTDPDNVTTELSKVMVDTESLEEDSGEITTPKTETNYSSVLSDENNASVDLKHDDIELIDMTIVSTEVSPKIDNSGEITLTAGYMTSNPMKLDVEMIDLLNKSQIYDHDKIKLIAKRESNPEDESDEVFGQLNDELNAEITERSLTDEEDKLESDRIFKQLLEESSTPKYRKPPKNKEEEMLQKVSDAIASVTLKKNPFDGNVLGIISNFFRNQNKSYK